MIKRIKGCKKAGITLPVAAAKLERDKINQTKGTLIKQDNDALKQD